MASRTMAEYLSEADARSFCGRKAELEALSCLFDPDSAIRIAFIHGPGGCGKSALLAELGRRARVLDMPTKEIDGRRLTADSSSLEQALTLPDEDAPSLVLIDTYEQMSGFDRHLRECLLPDLPAVTRVVIAGRRPPAAAWAREGWGSITLEIALGPLSREDSSELLRRRGIDDVNDIEALVQWGRGEALALTLAAEAARHSAGFDPASLDADDKVAERLLRQIGDGEVEGSGDDLLLVASIARTVNAQLLAAVIEGTDGVAAERWLRGLSFSEKLGNRTTLHERVRTAIRTQAIKRDPRGVDYLRRRIADHLYRRALAGEPELAAEITALIQDPLLRAGFNGSAVHQADRLRPGDAAVIADKLAASHSSKLPSWWPGIARYLEQAPERVVVARDDAGELIGFAIAATPANAPSWVHEDRVLGPWIEHARATAPDGDALVWRDTFDFSTKSTNAGSEVVALLNAAVTIRSGLANPRWFYGPVAAEDPVAAALSAAIGAVHLEDLDVTDGERRLQCHRLDHGPGGVIATTYRMVLQELEPEEPATSLTEFAAQTDEAVAATPELLRSALRNYHRPERLAASRLARGETVAERAEYLRRSIKAALEVGFEGRESRHDQQLRAVLERGYLDPDSSHARAMLDLHMSRSTYFRRLREATERLAASFSGLDS